MRMMKKQVAAVVIAFSVVGGVASGVVANAVIAEDKPAAISPAATSTAATGPTPVTTPRPSTSPSTTTTADASEGGESGMAAPDQLTITPGAVGPVRAGMSKAEALATGYFVADVKAPVEGCPDRPLAWKDEYVNTYDVLTLGNGEISSIGIRGRGVLTDRGVGVGSTYDQVKAAYPDETLVDAGYVQSGIRVYDAQNGGWLGFLFDATPQKISGSDRVTFVEVTQGGQPDLMRDGC